MKKQIKLILIASVSFLLLYVYSVNSSFRFSVPSGFYEEDFYLEIKAPSKEIYYTLDGSIPTRDSIPYTEPILITDASLNENVHSMREDVSIYFLEELILEHIPIETYTNMYKTPDYLIDKCTILRAVYYDVFGVEQEVKTATYFVGYQEKTGYDTKYTISLVTEPDNLFDYDTGIYVLGTTFGEFLETITEQDSSFFTGLGRVRYWPANYKQKGIDWEREANMLLFDQEGNLVFCKDVGVRIQGNTSRVYNPKSLNIYIRKEYDHTEQLEYSFWEDSDYYPDKFTISSGGTDIYTKFKDRLASELIQGLDVATFHYEPCTLFLNGEYWGVCHLAEKYTDDYFAYYYDVDPNNVVIIKANRLEEGTEDDYEDYSEFKKFIQNEDVDFTEPETYEYLWTKMDKVSTIDYFALKLYLGRTGDWIPMGGNSAFWKTSTVGEGAYEDGKWRWAVYDMNWGTMHGSYHNIDPIADTRERVGWFDKLCENEDFTNLLSNRLFELMETDFQEQRSFDLIDSYIVEMADAMELHYQRFFVRDTSKFYTEMDDIRTFFDGRNENMKRFIFENFGIEESKEISTLENNKISYFGHRIQGIFMLTIVFACMFYYGWERNRKEEE